MTLANALTLLRIALIPVFAWLWSSERYAAALWVFGAAAVSDVLDGFVARTMHQKSRLGAILDPAADKLMLLVVVLVAAHLEAVPWWFAAIVIGRDALLVTGVGLVALVARGGYDIDRFGPTRIGKYSTFFQVLTIGLALLWRATGAEGPRPWVAALVLVAGLATVSSGLQYLAAAVTRLGGPHAPLPPLAPPRGLA